LAWLLAAGFVLATVVPLGWFGLIDRPAAVGQVPDGVPAPAAVGPSGEGRSAGAAKSGEPDDADAGRWWTGLVPGRPAGVAPGVDDAPALTRDQAVRTRQFWILASVSTTVGMLITGLNFHQIDLLGEAGLSSSQAAAMFLPQIIGSSATGIAVGWLIDRVGVRYVPAFAMALLIVVHVLGASLSAGPLVFLYAISLGATAGAARATAGTLLPGYFGTDHIGSIQGVLTVCGVAGSAAGPVTMALAEGWLGSYRAANLALMTLPIVALAFTLTNRPIDTQAA
jgi:hypothetical protein